MIAKFPSDLPGQFRQRFKRRGTQHFKPDGFRSIVKKMSDQTEVVFTIQKLNQDAVVKLIGISCECHSIGSLFVELMQYLKQSIALSNLVLRHGGKRNVFF